MAQKSARGAISKIQLAKSCGLPCPICVPNLVRIGSEMAEKSKRFRFCMGPYGNAIYKDRRKNTISGVIFLVRFCRSLPDVGYDEETKSLSCIVNEKA